MFFFLGIYSTTIFLVFTKVLGDIKFCLGTFIFFATLVLFGMIFDGEFDNSYTKFFNYFYRKTNAYLALNNLKTHFQSIEKQIEEQAVLILSEVEKEARARLSDNVNINYYLRRKRNPDLYSYEIGKVKKNYELNQRTLMVFDTNIAYIKFDLEKHKYFEKLQLELRYENRHFTNFLWNIGRVHSQKNISTQNTVNNSTEVKKTQANHPKIQQDKNRSFWRRYKKSFGSNPLGINEQPTISETKNEQPISRITPDEILGKSDKKTDRVVKHKKTKTIELPESSVFKDKLKSNQPNLDFEKDKNSLNKVENLPVIKKKKMTYEGIIKASPDFYRNLQDKKMAIGEKGELLAMEYERKKLKSEIKGTSTNELEHISKTQGDGFGYDIRSIENEEEIYIEVKTTTGNFNSNLFFTNRELEAMNKYDENYYLYRIFNFDEVENTGDFYIFRGKNKITEYFNFNPTVYKLEPKENL